MFLPEALPLILPKAVAWACEREREIMECGELLAPAERDLAIRMGVSSPGRVRLRIVERLPVPDDPMLCAAAASTGLLGPGIVGLTLGHGIYICRGHRTAQLVSHECRHVHQYEQAGSIGSFLAVYLQQLAKHGYANAPLERATPTPCRLARSWGRTGPWAA